MKHKLKALFGQIIRIDHKLIRAAMDQNTDYCSYYAYYGKQFLINPEEALVVGYRNVSNGTVLIDRVEGNTYVPKHTYPVLLVTLSPKTKPFYVLPTEDNLKGSQGWLIK